MWSAGALWPGSRAWSCTPLGRTSFSFRNYTLLQNVYKFFLKDTHINSYIAIQRTGSLKHFHWETIGVQQVFPIEPGVAAEDRLGITGGLKAIPTAEQVLFQLLRVEIAKSGNSAHKYTPQQNAGCPPLWGAPLLLLVSIFSGRRFDTPPLPSG